MLIRPGIVKKFDISYELGFKTYKNPGRSGKVRILSLRLFTVDYIGVIGFLVSLKSFFNITGKPWKSLFSLANQKINGGKKSMPSLELINISKSYQKGKESLKVLENFNLGIKDKEFVSLFGPNGCGKTTLLKIIAGIEKVDCGEILFDGKAGRLYDVGFVFQDYMSALFPWRTVEKNVYLGPEFRGVGKYERKEIAKAILQRVGLLEHKDKYPYQLSGGLAQLVAICRTLAYKPSLLLFDEPFSSLDYKFTLEMEEKLLNLWEEDKKTTIFVSHDVDEAVFMADRVIVLSSHPARIKGIIETELARPRNFDIMQSEEFFEKRNEVIKLFKE